MPKQARSFPLPPATTDDSGEGRRVGVELEFGSISSEEAARALERNLGGRLTVEDEHLCRLSGSALGNLTIKLDTRYAHKGDSDASLSEQVSAFLSNLFGKAGSLVLPVEVVTEPLALDELPQFEQVIDILREAGAGGTGDRALYAFALQLNPQTPSRDPRAIVAILKAFVVLNEWLRAELHPKTLRKALRFVERYPRDYRNLVTGAEYWPTREEMIDDYIQANPSRNRDLDMLPLFLNLDEERVRRRLPDEKIGNRPTFHYRLPGARLGDPDWNLAFVWRTWVAVETLAADTQRLQSACAAYRAFRGSRKECAEQARDVVMALERGP